MTGVEVRVEGLSKCNDDPEAVLAEAAGTAQPPRRLRGAEQVCEDAAAGEQNREQYAKLVQESRARSSWPPRAASP